MTSGWRLAPAGAATCLVALAVAAAAGCTPPPPAGQAIDRMLDALGPERARSGIRILRTIAEGQGPAGPFVTTVTSIRPDTVYFHRQDAHGTLEIWSTPERTWGGSNGEAYAEFAPSVREFVRGREFFLLLLDMRARFSDFRAEGEDTVGGQACLRISMTYESGSAASVCLSRDSWLPLEMQWQPDSTEKSMRIEFSDWRVEEGIRYFNSFRLTEGNGDAFTYEYVEISANSFGQELELAAPTLPERAKDGT